MRIQTAIVMRGFSLGHVYGFVHGALKLRFYHGWYVWGVGVRARTRACVRVRTLVCVRVCVCVRACARVRASLRA